MNLREWKQLEKGDLVELNGMARSDEGMRCVVENAGEYTRWPYICIIPEKRERFPNGARTRFISYKCLNVLKE